MARPESGLLWLISPDKSVFYFFDFVLELYSKGSQAVNI